MSTAEGLQNLIHSLDVPLSPSCHPEPATWALVQTSWADDESWITTSDRLAALWEHQASDDWLPVMVVDLETGTRFEVKTMYALGNRIN